MLIMSEVPVSSVDDVIEHQMDYCDIACMDLDGCAM